jgi:hypothetical protein
MTFNTDPELSGLFICLVMGDVDLLTIVAASLFLAWLTREFVDVFLTRSIVSLTCLPGIKEYSIRFESTRH